MQATGRGTAREREREPAKTITETEWQKKLQDTSVTREHMDQLVLNFLVTEVRKCRTGGAMRTTMLAMHCILHEATDAALCCGVLSCSGCATCETELKERPVRSISLARMPPFRSYPVRHCRHFSECMPMQGYMDAARAFQEEAGMPVSQPMEVEDARMHVRNAVEEGEIEEAIERVNDLNPEVSVLYS